MCKKLVFIMLFLMVIPAFAVTNFKISDYGAGHQIWFEVEDFDERNPDNEDNFALSDEPGAFGRSINSFDAGGDGSSFVRYTFNIGAAGGDGGTWYFWGRVINPSNQSDFMLVDGHPGDQTPVTTLPVAGLANGQRVFEENVGTPGNWAWGRSNHGEGHTKQLQDGENTMWILNRQSGAIWDVFMWTDDPAYIPTDDDYINARPGGGYGFASKPNPEDGAMISDTWVSLDWRPGDFAVSHDIYLGENFDDVNNGTADTFRGSMGSNNSIAGFPGFPYPEGLVPGTTYYWRVDEVNDADPNSPWRGNVWSFWLPPTTAYDPSPADGAKYVNLDTTLTWQVGFGAKLHNIVFGETFEEVDSAPAGNPRGNPNFTPGTLEAGKTYYWRVDEFNPPTTVKGDVWSFTATLPGLGKAIAERWENIPTTDINALKDNPKFPNNPDVTEEITEFSWNGPDTDDYGGRIEAWVYIPLTGDYTFWLNTDDQGELWLSTDDDSSNVVLIAQESSYSSLNAWGGGEEKSEPIPLVGGEKYYIMALWKEGGGGDHCQVAWQGPGIPSRTIIPGANLSPFEPLSAYGAKPGNRATGVTQSPILEWKPGLETASHEVYFGTDEQAVANATKASPEYKGSRALGSESFDPGKLPWESTFYWRVDEINTANPESPWIGSVWSFTTADFLIVEDFESYTDDDAANEAIWQHWIDGFGVPTNGSQAGYLVPPYAEQTTVHGGRQSIPLFYFNTGGVMNSEAMLALTNPRDWTEGGVTELSIWFQGRAASVGSFIEAPVGTYTITATGADIWNQADQFHFAYRTLTGAGTIVARVESVQLTDVWAKAGIMIRETLDAGSKFAAVYIMPTNADGTPTNGCRFQGREDTDASAVSDSSVATAEQMAVTAPYWVKLERDVAGNFRGSYSSNGTSWTPLVWRPNVSMESTVYIGLALTSHNNNAVGQAVFSNVTITGNVGGQWTSQDIGIASNAAEPLYVAVSNATGSAAVVSHPDPAAANITAWTEWVIPLQEFADKGINLANVDKIAIGLGSTGGASTGGSGVMYIDDIRLYRPRTTP